MCCGSATGSRMKQIWSTLHSNGVAQGVCRQRLCKCGNYATVEESGVFRAVNVAPQPLLCSAEVNTFPIARRQL
jgi:hypothetical protein